MTSDRPTFFVPNVAQDEQEQRYAELAAAIGHPVPAPGERIYSISFRHDGEDWTATVGQQLKGTRTVVKGGRYNRTERTVHLANAATVLAIFPGHPFRVWHDGASGVWANPFMAGDPHPVIPFRAE